MIEMCFKLHLTQLGQHIGQLDHLLPEPYVETMRDNLLDRCPVSSYDEVGKDFESC